MTHNKNRNLLSNLLIKCISASQHNKYCFLKLSFSNFLVVGLCKSSDNCWLGTFSLSVADLSRVAKVCDRVRVRKSYQKI